MSLIVERFKFYLNLNYYCHRVEHSLTSSTNLNNITKMCTDYLIRTRMVEDPLGVLFIEIEAMLHQELKGCWFHHVVLITEGGDVVGLDGKLGHFFG